MIGTNLQLLGATVVITDVTEAMQARERQQRLLDLEILQREIGAVFLQTDDTDAAIDQALEIVGMFLGSAIQMVAFENPVEDRVRRLVEEQRRAQLLQDRRRLPGLLGGIVADSLADSLAIVRDLDRVAGVEVSGNVDDADRQQAGAPLA